MPLRHRCVKPHLDPANPFAGKVMYTPTLADGGVEALAAVFRWMGIESHPTPASDARTCELGRQNSNGEECYPLQITIGDFLRIAEQPGFDPKRTVFMMANSDGPCRFGQYGAYLERLLREKGLQEVQVFKPGGQTGYAEFGELSTVFLRTAWRAIVATDLFRRRLLQTRPYETVPGAADQAFHASVGDLCATIEASCSDPACQMRSLLSSLERARDRFHNVPARYDNSFPLIGVVGEIFCRLNTFSNNDLIRKLERHSAEAWLSNIGEWISYCNEEEVRKLKLNGQTWSWTMARSLLRDRIQQADEHAMGEVFAEDLEGVEDPRGSEEILSLAHPYLPYTGVEGEMVLSMGKAAYLARHGVDGIVDISPFTCMNGIVSEAIYPKLSRDHDNIPIRNFYFDGTESDLDRDLGIYLELARSYQTRKRWPRRYPKRFEVAA